MPEGHTTVLRKLPLDVYVPLGRRALPASATCSDADRLLSMCETSVMIFGSDGAPRLASAAVGVDPCDDVLTLYPDYDDGNYWSFADVRVDSQVDIRACLLRDFNASGKLCRSVNIAVPDDASFFFILALQNIKPIIERDSAVAANSDALEGVWVVEETAAASLANWTLEKTDMVREDGRVRPALDCLNTH